MPHSKEIRANANAKISEKEKDGPEKSTMANLGNETKDCDDDVNRKEPSHVEGAKLQQK